MLTVVVLIILLLLIFLMMMSGTRTSALMRSCHSNEFRMIPTDEAETVYGPIVKDGEVVFRPVEFSEETTAPQRVDRRTSTPVERRSSPPSLYVKSF
jgi:hypothetical protein